MHTELTLLIPDSLLLQLELRARTKGTSIEDLCVELLSVGNKDDVNLIDPAFYSVLSHDRIRTEINRVVESSLEPGEIRTRLNKLTIQLSRMYR